MTFKAPAGRAKALAAGARALLPGGALVQVESSKLTRQLRVNFSLQQAYLTFKAPAGRAKARDDLWNKGGT